MKKVLQFLVLCLFGTNVFGQNIFSGEPVQVVGSYNGYSTSPYGSDYRTTTYRKLSTLAGTPTDGRGQWATTINVQSSGGDVLPTNMSGGGGNGFLFISGPAGNRYQNKWVFSSVTSGVVNSINTCDAYNSGQDMGFNMNTTGYYTFVFNDCGYSSTNAKYYVGRTSAAPVSISTVNVSPQFDRTAIVNLTTSATPSSEENVFVRYVIGSSADFSGTTTTALVQATGTGSSWTATIPTVALGSTVKFYVFTSTLSLAVLNAASEINRSLATLKYNDNSGVNYQYYFASTITTAVEGGLASNPLTWSGNLPSAGVNVVMNHNITLDVDAAIGSLTINNKTLSIGTQNLLITGDIAGGSTGGIIASSTGVVTLNGLAAQAISGKVTMNFVAVTNTSGVTITGTSANLLNIAGSISVGSGASLTTNDNLMLLSTALYTASIGTSLGTITGKVICSKYIAGGGLSTDIPSARGYRFLAHPFNTSIALSQLQTAIDITGTGGIVNGFNPTTTNNPSAFYWNAATANGASNDLGWTAFANTTSNSWARYQAARIFYRGAKGTGLDGAAYTVSNSTLLMTGLINSGDQSISLTYPNTGTTSNFNFVGNPYASNVQMSGVSNTNTTSSYYVWDITLGTRGAYRTLSFGNSYVLPAYAGLLVETSAASASLVFHEADKTLSNATNTLLKTGSNFNLLLQLKSDKVLWDELKFEFDNLFKKAREYTDAKKLRNPEVSLFSLSSDDTELAIDNRNIDMNPIALGLITNAARTFTISTSQINLPIGISLYLHDKYTNNTVLIDGNMQYSFTTDANAASQGNNRFEIITKQPLIGVVADLEVKMSPNPVKDILTVNYSLPNESEVMVRVLDNKGQQVQTLSLGNSLKGNCTINMGKFAKGIYTVELIAGSEKASKLVVKQ